MSNGFGPIGQVVGKDGHPDGKAATVIVWEWWTTSAGSGLGLDIVGPDGYRSVVVTHKGARELAEMLTSALSASHPD